MSSREKNNNLQFGLTIPQGWRGGDLPLEEDESKWDPIWHLLDFGIYTRCRLMSTSNWSFERQNWNLQ